MAEETRLDKETAQAEAGLIKEIAEPQARRAFPKIAAQNEKVKEMLPQLGETAFLEFGSQILDQLEEEQPHLYNALVTEEKALNRLIGDFYPEYASLGQKHFLPPTQRKTLASQQPPEAKAEAIENAARTAFSLTRRVAKDAAEHLEKDRNFLDKSRGFSAAAAAVQKEIDEGHFIQGSDPHLVGSFVSCVLAAMEVDRLGGISYRPKFTPSIAQEKQAVFNEREKERLEKEAAQSKPEPTPPAK
jgi:hypothetical protein